MVNIKNICTLSTSQPIFICLVIVKRMGSHSPSHAVLSIPGVWKETVAAKTYLSDKIDQQMQ